MSKMIRFIKKLFSKKDYNSNFSTTNQPCFDKNGKFLGWFSRSVATVLFVFCRNKEGEWCVLASERGKGAADFQGYWNSCCGYINYNETIAEGAARETLEETGVNIPLDKIEFIGYEDSPSANHQNITFRFAAFINDKFTDEFAFSHKGNEKDEVGKIKWIPINEVNRYQWAFGHLNRIMEIYHSKVS